MGCLAGVKFDVRWRSRCVAGENREPDDEQVEGGAPCLGPGRVMAVAPASRAWQRHRIHAAPHNRRTGRHRRCASALPVTSPR